jgi:hypothetical protein
MRSSSAICRTIPLSHFPSIIATLLYIPYHTVYVSSSDNQWRGEFSGWIVWTIFETGREPRMSARIASPHFSPVWPHLILTRCRLLLSFVFRSINRCCPGPSCLLLPAFPSFFVIQRRQRAIDQRSQINFFLILCFEKL